LPLTRARPQHNTRPRTHLLAQLGPELGVDELVAWQAAGRLDDRFGLALPARDAVAGPRACAWVERRPQAVPGAVGRLEQVQQRQHGLEVW
jgi:hypothetical protein